MDEVTRKILLCLLSNDDGTVEQSNPQPVDPWIGEYVIVRCRDAGVHAGVLVSRQGRQCELRDSRRFWKWKTVNDDDFLSGLAKHGIHEDSTLGCPVNIILTENCEIIRCTDASKMSIRGHVNVK